MPNEPPLPQLVWRRDGPLTGPDSKDKGHVRDRDWQIWIRGDHKGTKDLYTCMAIQFGSVRVSESQAEAIVDAIINGLNKVSENAS